MVLNLFSKRSAASHHSHLISTAMPHREPVEAPRPSSNSTQFPSTCCRLPWDLCGLEYRCQPLRMHGNAHKVVLNTAHDVSIFATSHVHCLLEALSPMVLRARAQGRRTETHPTRPELARLTCGYPGVIRGGRDKAEDPSNDQAAQTRARAEGKAG